MEGFSAIVMEGETALNKALLEIEKALPSKSKKFVSATGAARASSGKTQLAKAGRECMKKLKKILPSYASSFARRGSPSLTRTPLW